MLTRTDLDALKAQVNTDYPTTTVTVGTLEELIWAAERERDRREWPHLEGRGVELPDGSEAGVVRMGSLPTGLAGSDETFDVFYRVYVDEECEIPDLKVLDYLFPQQSCGHEHDCCGCIFRSFIEIEGRTKQDDDRVLLVKVSYGRNI